MSQFLKKQLTNRVLSMVTLVLVNVSPRFTGKRNVFGCRTSLLGEGYYHPVGVFRASRRRVGRIAEVFAGWLRWRRAWVNRLRNLVMRRWKV